MTYDHDHVATAAFSNVDIGKTVEIKNYGGELKVDGMERFVCWVPWPFGLTVVHKV